MEARLKSEIPTSPGKLGLVLVLVLDLSVQKRKESTRSRKSTRASECQADAWGLYGYGDATSPGKQLRFPRLEDASAFGFYEPQTKRTPPTMPSSILVPALILLLTGAGMTFAGSRFDALSSLIWIGIGAMTAGAALLLRKSWGRTLASVIIFAGYAACGFALLSLYGPARKPGVEDHLFLYFLGVFAAVAILTILSGNLWSRSAAGFLAKAGSERR